MDIPQSFRSKDLFQLLLQPTNWKVLFFTIFQMKYWRYYNSGKDNEMSRTPKTFRFLPYGLMKYVTWSHSVDSHKNFYWNILENSLPRGIFIYVTESEWNICLLRKFGYPWYLKIREKYKSWEFYNNRKLR